MTDDLFSLSGRVCMITGASSGLGRRIAICLAEAGAVVVLTGRRQALLKEVEKAIADIGGQAHSYTLDVNNRTAVEQTIDTIEEQVGPIWCLVNNSGVVVMNRPENFSEEQYDDVLDTNLKAPFHLCQVVGRKMIARHDGGRIINMASIGAQTELEGGITYCMSKAALVTMTKCLAVEWARYGIHVNAISPGYIETEMTSQYYGSEQGQKTIAGWPGKRIGKPKDLDGIILLLASSASEFMNGSIVSVDDAQPLGFFGNSRQIS